MIAEGRVIGLRLPDLILFSKRERGNIIQIANLLGAGEARFSKLLLIELRMREEVIDLVSVTPSIQRKLFGYRPCFNHRVKNMVVFH